MAFCTGWGGPPPAALLPVWQVPPSEACCEHLAEGTIPGMTCPRWSWKLRSLCVPSPARSEDRLSHSP